MIAAHAIFAKIAMAEGDPATAELETNAAVSLLSDFPAPLVAWKTYSMLGRLHTQLGKCDAARVAFGEATSLIDNLCNHIFDRHSCAISLNSPPVQESLSHSRASSGH